MFVESFYWGTPVSAGPAPYGTYVHNSYLHRKTAGIPWQHFFGLFSTFPPAGDMVAYLEQTIGAVYHYLCICTISKHIKLLKYALLQLKRHSKLIQFSIK